jgi:hypothetical protein
MLGCLNLLGLCSAGGRELSESEDLAAQARLAKAIVWDLLEQAKRLRVKAVELEKASDRLRAAAARDLAEYLEGAAAEFRRP